VVKDANPRCISSNTEESIVGESSYIADTIWPSVLKNMRYAIHAIHARRKLLG
jgi:hypothetical protein